MDQSWEVFSVDLLERYAAKGRGVITCMAAGNDVIVLGTSKGWVIRHDFGVGDSYEIDLSADRPSEQSVHRVFVDPGGSHCVATVVGSGGADTFYTHAKWNRPRGLTRLRGLIVNAVAWNRQQITEASTREVILGTENGQLYEMAVDEKDKREKYVKSLYESTELPEAFMGLQVAIQVFSVWSMTHVSLIAILYRVNNGRENDTRTVRITKPQSLMQTLESSSAPVPLPPDQNQKTENTYEAQTKVTIDNSLKNETIGKGTFALQDKLWSIYAAGNTVPIPFLRATDISPIALLSDNLIGSMQGNSGNMITAEALQELFAGDGQSRKGRRLQNEMPLPASVCQRLASSSTLMNLAKALQYHKMCYEEMPLQELQATQEQQTV